MADCLISSVKEIGKCILTQHVWPFLKSQVDYWWFCDSNIKFLRDEIPDLERQIDNVTKKIDEAPENAEIRRRAVHEWLSSSKQKLEEAKTTLPNDNIPAWKLISRYSLGKNAKETAEAIANLRNDGMRLTTDVSTMDFDSRKHIEEKIIDSLERSSVGVIGICGMGGVGKTTMAKRIGRRVKEENLFEEVAMTTVSQKIDKFKIQEEIAKDLDLKLDENEKDLSVRAKKLRPRLMDIKRKIIIFDDVWESLDFEALGIPIESNLNRCKFLFTSRSRESCKDIENKEVFELKTLRKEEAWNLFREKAGKCAENFGEAKDVVEECKGLPIALVTVGVALRGKTNISKWKDSLSQLRKSNPTDFPEVLKDVYKPLQLSYDCLDSNSERRLFLLCCLFPEDFHISVEELTWYSLGLGLFDDINNIEEARDRTHTLIEKLESRFLLIDVENYGVKMHDVIRDMAIYIGSREKDGFLKSLHGTSIENSSDINYNCNWMSVDISNEGMKVPVLSRFPKLRLLMLQQKSRGSSNEILDISVEGMTELNVLSFRNTSMRSLPPTLGSLKKLHTLCLVDCKVENISVIGELTSLRILELDDCQITSCPKLARKCLLQLEVLWIGRCESMEQVFWNECTDDNTDGCIEFPMLKKLRLRNLPNLTAFCQGLENIIIKFPNLTEFDIGGLPKLNSLSPLNSETLVGHDQNTCFHFLCNPKVKMGLLMELTLTGSKDTNISHIWCHQISNNVFNNLEVLHIGSMNGISSLMSTSIAKNLVSLERLIIYNCEEMVEVIERDDDDKQVVDINCLFANLRKLWIWWLPKLRMFWQWNHALELPLLENVEIYKCPVMETFTLGFINTPNMRAITVNDEKIDDPEYLNYVIRHIWTQSQNKHKGKNEYVDLNENKDEDGYEEENKDDQDHFRIKSEEDEDNMNMDINDQHKIGEVSLKIKKDVGVEGEHPI